MLTSSFERIHRSNLVGMGILPLQFLAGETADTLKLWGEEAFSIDAVESGQKEVTVRVSDGAGQERAFGALIRIDTPNEFSYYRHGGILHYVLRRLAGTANEDE